MLRTCTLLGFAALAVRHGKQFGADDGDDAPLVDVFEQVIPEKFLGGWGRVHKEPG